MFTTRFTFVGERKKLLPDYRNGDLVRSMKRRFSFAKDETVYFTYELWTITVVFNDFFINIPLKTIFKKTNQN